VGAWGVALAARLEIPTREDLAAAAADLCHPPVSLALMPAVLAAERRCRDRPRKSVWPATVIHMFLTLLLTAMAVDGAHLIVERRRFLFVPPGVLLGSSLIVPGCLRWFGSVRTATQRQSANEG